MIHFKQNYNSVLSGRHLACLSGSLDVGKDAIIGGDCIVQKSLAARGVRAGDGGVVIEEIRELTGTTNKKDMSTKVPLPQGWTGQNTRGFFVPRYSLRTVAGVA